MSIVSLPSAPDNGGASPTTPCADRRIPCRVLLRPIPNSPQTELVVFSPKTGKALSIGDGWFTELRALAPRVIGKAAHARSVGQAIAHLSISELKAIAAVHQIILDKCKPLPAGGLFRRYAPSGRRVRGRRWG